MQYLQVYDSHASCYEVRSTRVDIPGYRLGHGLSGSTCSGRGTGPRFPGSGCLSGGPGRGVGGDGVGCGRGGGCGLLWSLMCWRILRRKIEALDR